MSDREWTVLAQDEVDEAEERHRSVLRFAFVLTIVVLLVALFVGTEMYHDSLPEDGTWQKPEFLNYHPKNCTISYSEDGEIAKVRCNLGFSPDLTG